MAKRPNPKAAAYARLLAAEMERHGVSQRELARRMEPSNVDNRRRWVVKVLRAEHFPSPANREAVAEALGVDYGALEPDDDEEDSALAMELLAVVRRVAFARETAA